MLTYSVWYDNLSNSINSVWFILHCLLSAFYSANKITIGSVIFVNTHVIPGLSNQVNPKHPELLLLSYYFLINGFFLKFMITSMLLLTLGSYWSVNEFNWGGFWSFDFLENTLVIQFTIICIFTHNYFRSYNFIKHWGVYILILFFFFLKFNDVSSIHSFLRSPSNYFTNFFILTLILNYFTAYVYIYIFLFMFNWCSFINYTWVGFNFIPNPFIQAYLHKNLSILFVTSLFYVVRAASTYLGDLFLPDRYVLKSDNLALCYSFDVFRVFFINQITNSSALYQPVLLILYNKLFITYKAVFN